MNQPHRDNQLWIKHKTISIQEFRLQHQKEQHFYRDNLFQNKFGMIHYDKNQIKAETNLKIVENHI